jgi:hypothetical protein
MAGLRRFGAKTKTGQDARPSTLVPRGEREDSEQASAAGEAAPDADDAGFGAIDFDSIGLESDAGHRSRLMVPPRPSSPGTAIHPSPMAAEATRIAGLSAVARAIAETQTQTSRHMSEAPPSSRSREVRSTSDVVPRRDRVEAMRELYAQGDAEAALAIASKLADGVDGSVPGGDRRHQERTAIAPSPTSRRLAAFTSQKVPRLIIAPQEIPSLPIDPRAAFIVGHVDGIQSMGDILDICAMPESEALELFDRLQALGVIEIG